MLCVPLWVHIDDQNVQHRGQKVTFIYIHGMTMLNTWLTMIDSCRAYGARGEVCEVLLEIKMQLEAILWKSSMILNSQGKLFS